MSLEYHLHRTAPHCIWCSAGEQSPLWRWTTSAPASATGGCPALPDPLIPPRANIDYSAGIRTKVLLAITHCFQ